MTVETTTIAVERVNSTVGAVVSGVQLSPDLPQGTVDQIQDALWRHGVLFFYDQSLTPETHLALGERFGPLDHHPLAPDPLAVLDSDAYDPSFDRSTGWHTDSSFAPEPPQTAILRPLVLPSVGGDTLWASMEAHYESLSTKLQHFLDGLTALHRLTFDLGTKMGAAADPSLAESYQAVHPVVITNPVTGRRGVYVNSNYTISLVELAERESQVVLRVLYDHITAPDLQVRLRWEPNSVAMWNERTTQHFGVGRYEGRRLMNRVIACGPAPV